MNQLRKYWADLAVVAAFAAIAFAYFMPADIDGRILYRHDSSAGRGAGQEQQQYLERTGERTRWTNATFSGMPTYQTAPSYRSTDMLSQAMNAYHLWLPENVWYVFAYLLGFYILLRAFDFRKELAALGSVLWAFSSYFLIIIAAGHIWKVMALAYLPPMIAGVVLAYRGRLLFGFLLTAVFTAFEIKANHVQMTYYFLFVLVLMVLAYLFEALIAWRKTKDTAPLRRFGKATAVCAAAAAIGVCINLSCLYHTWQYGQESMRGKSELVKKNAANQTSSGLDRDYITQWSYGIDETWTLLVPNAKGGASVPLTMSETAMEKADPQFTEIYQQLGQYWGDQPGTSGPVYVGAAVMFLFILALFITRGQLKWALIGATVLSVLLAWGRNFMPFTDFFIDHVPMYAKFRTVASILVIAEFTIPLLAVMALAEALKDPAVLTRKIKYVWAAFILTGGVCLLMAWAPSLFFADFISEAEMQALGGIPQEYLAPLLANLRSMREAMLTADCYRSFIVIAIAMALLLIYKVGKIKPAMLCAALGVLCLIDLWQVDKRYLYDDMFVEKSVREQPQPMTETDKLILADKTPDFRVLNLASNTFNENETSYYHKSIGGYHAAKLRRYQELIDAHIAPEMRRMGSAIVAAGGDMTRVNGDSIWPVLNALNTRYVIMPVGEGKTVPVLNTYAYGNAWFVSGIDYVADANAELSATGKLNLRTRAVADQRFRQQLGAAESKSATSEGTVKLTAYEPNCLHYTATSAAGGVVVFSEIYYPGWAATIDGKPAELGRVDYVLRALRLPAGQHDVVLTFKPASIRHTEATAYAAYLVLLLAAGAAVWARRKKKTI